MKLIESRANPFFKSLVRMHQEAGKPGRPVLLEGIHLCQSWLNAGYVPDWVVVDRAVEHRTDTQQLIQATAPQSQVLLEPGLFKSVSDVITAQAFCLWSRRLPTHCRWTSVKTAFSWIVSRIREMWARSCARRLLPESNWFLPLLRPPHYGLPRFCVAHRALISPCLYTKGWICKHCWGN